MHRREGVSYPQTDTDGMGSEDIPFCPSMDHSIQSHIPYERVCVPKEAWTLDVLDG